MVCGLLMDVGVGVCGQWKGIHAYPLVSKIIEAFEDKARCWLQGRKGVHH